MKNTKVSDYNKQGIDYQYLEELRNEYISLTKNASSKSDEYYGYLTSLFNKGYSKNFLAKHVTAVSGIRASVQYIGRVINQFNSRKGRDKHE